MSVHPCGLMGKGHSTGIASFSVPYFVYVKVVLCRLDISEFSVCSCYRCCVLCNITQWVVACTACRLDIPVAPAHPQSDRERSLSSGSNFLANTEIKNNNNIEFNDTNISNNKALCKRYTPISQLSEIIKPKIKIQDCSETWSLSTDLHGVSSQRTVILILTALRISNRNPPQ